VVPAGVTHQLAVSSFEVVSSLSGLSCVEAPLVGFVV
jgi:hypothetical protein